MSGKDFLSTLAKNAGRAQERVMQKLGKADETVDEVFQTHVKNFTKQLAVATRLQKDARSLMQAIQAMSNATKSLADSMVEAFDDGWSGATEFQEQAAIMVRSCHQFQQHAGELLSQSMNGYVNGQFPDLKNRIAKRDRKLIDYDRYRHALQGIKAKSKASDSKLTQAEEEHAQAKEIYEELNAQLNNDLPVFYEARIPFYKGVCHELYSAMFSFHETSTVTSCKLHQISAERSDISPAAAAIENLPSSIPNVAGLSGSTGFLGTASSTSPSHTTTSSSAVSQSASTGSANAAPAPVLSPAGKAPSTSNLHSSSSMGDVSGNSPSSGRGSTASGTAAAAAAATANAGNRKLSAANDDDAEITKRLEDLAVEFSGDSEPSSEPAPVLPPTAASVAAPAASSPATAKKKQGPKVLYTVRATHHYDGMEDDELTFGKGDIIMIVDTPPELELDEGWAYGVRQDGKKGVLPVNFTERLERTSKAYML
ncbi:hypothetical protein CAOG_04611 [Capsaspora owczarzaki ATCC 30864]|uniref:SH3 domain-containing protein n=1 Tax=Capsaspora owczarzaki (strain ATCC 30864) TaxID=595528 RepID=A0A0D2WRK1_CAPO3|nr:hypothetical protein CAOG_04611 [Capsaspora owczarzaki ATCC 30864]KJE93893.1 hypothetical protein CAOG_004611 [Capsaspora owczarzaki ATCC 30864]|eukprot:XP_004347358.1 hypothetical protein CAOG_04611 [Capsaspora owczarzaki ATCC 30864]